MILLVEIFQVNDSVSLLGLTQVNNEIKILEQKIGFWPIYYPGKITS